MTNDILILILGLVTLVIGGEFLVKGAVGVDRVLLITPLVIGMTVVSFGTSAPELLVSVNSAMNGSPGIAVGNVVGSNIANLALVLGMTVLIFPIIAGRQTKRVDWPVMIGATLGIPFLNYEETQLNGASKKKKLSSISVFDEMKMNNQSFKKMKTLIADLSNLMNNYHLKIDGLLGYEFLSKSIISINFKKKELYFWKPVQNEQDSKEEIKVIKKQSEV